jgi:hypothetical protein
MYHTTKIIYNYFSRFLHLIHEHSAENKMTADNLALVFGPNILSPEVRTYFVHTCLADHGILVQIHFFPMDNRSIFSHAWITDRG